MLFHAQRRLARVAGLDGVDDADVLVGQLRCGRRQTGRRSFRFPGSFDNDAGIILRIESTREMAGRVKTGKHSLSRHVVSLPPRAERARKWSRGTSRASAKSAMGAPAYRRQRAGKFCDLCRIILLEALAIRGSRRDFKTKFPT
jgi:hypothetical protein